ncbi:MAG: glycosyl transferase family 2, partial [Lentimonas sp.]
IPAAVGPSLGYLVCQYYGHPEDWKERVLRLPFLLVVGFGICLSNAKAVLEGLFGNDRTFVRTPKSGGESVKHYAVKTNWVPRVEMMLAGYCVITVGVLGHVGQFGLIPFVVIYALGFGVVGTKSLREARA